MISKKLTRTTCYLIAVLFILLLGGIYAYFTYLTPERMQTTIEEQLQEKLKARVLIGNSSMHIFRGPAVSLFDVEIERPPELHIKASVISARISLWHLFLGKIKIDRIHLISPDIFIRAESIKSAPLKRPLSLPTIEIDSGSMKVLYKEFELCADEINGRIRPTKINLVASVCGANARFDAQLLIDQWQAELAITALSLDKINPGAGGISNIALRFNGSRNALSVSFEAKTQDLKLPWSEKILSSTSLTINAEGNKDALMLETIKLETPLIAISGTGKISNIQDKMDSLVDLNLESSEFDYENLVSALPTNMFPEKVATLLTRQIRQGKSRFSSLMYKGTLTEMLKPRSLMKNIVLVEEIDGQSLGYDLDVERVTGITGSMIMSDGNIAFQNLSGKIGKSEIADVDISFYDVANPGIRASVGVELDMELADFLDAWRAVMFAEKLKDSLVPASNVTSGKIRTRTSAYWDSATGKPLQAKGEIYLTDCSFMWNKNLIRQLSGSVNTPDFDTPLFIELAGKLNKLDIEKLSMSLSDPFGQQTYTFTMHTRGLPPSKAFGLDSLAGITLMGEGIGPHAQGRLDLKSQSFELFGTKYTPVEGLIRGKGDFTVSVQPDFEFRITKGQLDMAPGMLNLDSRLVQKGGELHLSGTLSLNQMKALLADEYQTQHGRISGDIRVGWGKKKTLQGSLYFLNSLVFYNNMPMELSGPVELKGDYLFSRALDLVSGKVRLSITGELLPSRPLHFEGNLSIDGLKTTKGSSGSMELLKMFSGKSGMKLTNLNIWGIPVSQATAQAELLDGTLRLNQIKMKGLSGSAEGKAVISPESENIYDITFSLKDADMKQLFTALSNNTSDYRGTMNLKGRLWSENDSINGDLTFDAHDGSIMKYTLISKIFGVLNIYKIIKKKELDLISRGLPYSSMSATFTIKDNLMQFDDFYLDSPSLQLSAVGVYAIDKKWIDSILVVQPLETIDKTLGFIPLLGWVLTGDDGKFIVVSLVLQGHTDNPSVRLAPVDTIAKPIAQTLLRLIKLPEKIITRPKDLIPGMNKQQTVP